MLELLSYQDWIDSLEERAAKISRIQATFSNFEVLPRLGKLLVAEADECPECNLYWQKLQESTEHLDQFFDDGNNYSANFDNLVEEILSHLKMQHSIRPKGYILSIYSIVGMGIGVAIGALVGWLFLAGLLKGAIMLGWLLGVMSGWFAGKHKEGKMRKANQIF